MLEIIYKINPLIKGFYLLKFIRYILVSLLLINMSCNLIGQQNISNDSNPELVSRDTLIIYDIDGISAEGTEAKVNYVNGKISRSMISIYGETGQASIIYEFEKDKINVSEKKFLYKTNIENVKFDTDMFLDYEISYTIDFKGNLINKQISEWIDIFKEFSDVVPFEI